MRMSINRNDLESLDLTGEITGKRLAPVLPGEILRFDYMQPLGLSARVLAQEIGVPVTRITEILHGERAITADTALRFGRRFKTSPELWLGLQNAHDLELARQALGWAA
jgi:antitoxin HigA-1